MRRLHKEKHLHLPPHIEPATAIIDAMRWERKDIDPRYNFIAVKKMVDAGAMRAARQYERLRRLAGLWSRPFVGPVPTPALAIVLVALLTAICLIFRDRMPISDKMSPATLRLEDSRDGFMRGA